MDAHFIPALPPCIPKHACEIPPGWVRGLGVPVEDQRASKRGQLVPQRRTAVWAVCALTAICLIDILHPASQTRELC